MHDQDGECSNEQVDTDRTGARRGAGWDQRPAGGR